MTLHAFRLYSCKKKRNAVFQKLQNEQSILENEQFLSQFNLGK